MNLSPSIVCYEWHSLWSPYLNGRMRHNEVLNHKNMAATHTTACRLMGGRTYPFVSLTLTPAIRYETASAPFQLCSWVFLVLYTTDLHSKLLCVACCMHAKHFTRRQFVFVCFSSFFFGWFKTHSKCSKNGVRKK